MLFREKQSIVMVLQKLKSDPDLLAQSQKAPRGYLTSKSLETSGPATQLFRGGAIAKEMVN